MSFICFAWGVVAAAFAGIKNQATFLALRFLLGIFEAGAFPGMVFYVSTLYPRNRTQVPMAAIVMGILVSQCVGAAMAAGFLSMDGINGMRGWQWLFLIEGLLCVLVSLYWVFVMPRSIETMKVRPTRVAACRQSCSCTSLQDICQFCWIACSPCCCSVDCLAFISTCTACGTMH
jgi:MFS family permease